MLSAMARRERLPVPKNPALKKRAERTIAKIREMRRQHPTPFYEMGKLLLSLREPTIWHIWADATFRDFLNQRVMPHSTAQRMIVIVEDLPEELAASLGQERSYQLCRLARIDPDVESAVDLWEQNPELGNPPKPLQSMKARELARLVRRVTARVSKSGRPPPSEKELEAIARVEAKVRARYGPDVDFDVSVRDGVVSITLGLDEFMAHVQSMQLDAVLPDTFPASDPLPVLREANYRVREEQPSDLDAIRTTIHDAFAEVEHSADDEAEVVDALRAANALTISLIAEDHEGVVGHIAISPVRLDDDTPGWFGLGPLAVAPSCQKRGIGGMLVRAALRKLRQRNAAGVVLVGEPDYYGRFGFVPAAPLVFPRVPAEYFLALKLAPSEPSGVVHYHEAFSA